MLKRDVRIVSLVICLALVTSGCGTPLPTPPPIPFDTPIARIELPPIMGSSSFAGGTIVAGKEAVWVVIPGRHAVFGIDPFEKKLARVIPVGASLASTVFHPDSSLVEVGNAIWVSTWEGGLVKIDPKSDQVVARIPFESGDPFLLSASDNAVWVGITESSWTWRWGPRHYRVSKIDPQANRVMVTLPQEIDPKSARVLPVPGTDALWILDHGEKTLARIDPTTGLVATSLALGPSFYPECLAVGEGAVWAPSTGEGVVLRLDPDTYQLSAKIPMPYPAHVRHGGFFLCPQFAQGAVWVGAGGRTPFGPTPMMVYAIDPTTNQVVATLNLRIGWGMGGIALGHDALWVSEIQNVGYKKWRLVIEVYRLPNWRMAHS